ncbi:unnamed protein product [Meloidogyne enterolobii]|uniref:Uncharacterized protein n=1 Tax=Meloidogyne enterolobii TaxID=390850 RepID=A0ACB0ZFI0_MELEN
MPNTFQLQRTLGMEIVIQIQQKRKQAIILYFLLRPISSINKWNLHFAFWLHVE